MTLRKNCDIFSVSRNVTQHQNHGEEINAAFFRHDVSHSVTINKGNPTDAQRCVNTDALRYARRRRIRRRG